MPGKLNPGGTVGFIFSVVSIGDRFVEILVDCRAPRLVDINNGPRT